MKKFQSTTITSAEMNQVSGGMDLSAPMSLFSACLGETAGIAAPMANGDVVGAIQQTARATQGWLTFFPQAAASIFQQPAAMTMTQPAVQQIRLQQQVKTQQARTQKTQQVKVQQRRKQ